MGNFLAQGYCFYWQPGVMWLNAISDLIIALAYISISATIGYVIYKREKLIPFQWLLTLFAMFIFLSGLTHLLELIGIWSGLYYIEGIIKLLTAAVSIATAILLFPLIPGLLEKLKDEEHGESEKNHENSA